MRLSVILLLGLILNNVNGVSDNENSPIAARIVIFNFDILHDKDTVSPTNWITLMNHTILHPKMDCLFKLTVTIRYA